MSPRIISSQHGVCTLFLAGLGQARSRSRLMLTGIAKARRLLPALAIACTVGILVPASAYASAPASSDITATSAGQAPATLAAQRLTGVGHPTAASSLRVIREANGTIKTMPKGMATTTGVGPDGTTVSGVVLQAPSSTITPGAVTPMSGAQYWNQINTGCLSETKSQGWMYNCWSLKKMYNGYDDYDFFILTFDGTANANNTGMHLAYVEVTKGSSSAPFTVVDWSPKSNPPPSNCHTITLSVSYILGFSMDSTQCENWQVYADPINNPGTQYSQWFLIGTVYNEARETTLVQQVETVKNATPIWNLYYDFQ